MAEKSKAIQKTAPQQIEASRPAEERETAFYRPNVDIVDLPDEFLVVADVPGAASDGIDVTFEEDVLTIDAKVPPRQDEEASRFFRREYGVGRFQRRFVVEAPVDADGLTAAHDHGVLTIHLPKAEKAKGRKIPVSSA
jgi:HSP20 family protein